MGVSAAPNGELSPHPPTTKRGVPIRICVPQLTDRLMIAVWASFMASDRWFMMAANRPLLTPSWISWR